jgi:hypothetical protein
MEPGLTLLPLGAAGFLLQRQQTTCPQPGARGRTTKMFSGPPRRCGLWAVEWRSIP